MLYGKLRGKRRLSKETTVELQPMGNLTRWRKQCPFEEEKERTRGEFKDAEMGHGNGREEVGRK